MKINSIKTKEIRAHDTSLIQLFIFNDYKVILACQHLSFK